MIDYILYKVLNLKPKCLHENVHPDSTGCFCPDCGKEIKIFWHILKCENCSSKRNAILRFNSIIPADNFCAKCGAKAYYVEKQEKLQFYDISYAIISREEIPEELKNINVKQIWIESESVHNEHFAPKLIPRIT